MHAVLMAGGRGRRFIPDIEKPLLNINGRPIIEIILDSLIELKLNKIIDRIVVCTTIHTPITERFALKLAAKKGMMSKNISYNILEVVRTGGKGCIEDLQECIKHLSLDEPFFYLPADIPLFDPEILKYIICTYQKVEEDALAVFTSKELYDKYKIKTDLILEYNNEKLIPTGINILNGLYIEEEQEEHKLILNLKDIEELPSLAYLAFNINYVENYIQLIKLCRQNNKIFTR